ncbi:MAG: metallophosphoesterase family protein, partial [Candidatus Omnitrophota bacterium]
LNFLKNLPQKYSIEEFKLAVFHGSPWDYRDEYIYPTDSLVRFKDLPYEFIFLGHTHYAMDSSINHVRVINPGSCGQPRDLHQPSYATVDLKNRKVEIKRVQYNPKLLIKDIMKYDKDEPYLVRVLKR